jgi:hypothetical protein
MALAVKCDPHLLICGNAYSNKNNKPHAVDEKNDISAFIS